MFLTEGGYKRKLVKRVFRQGADSILTIHSVTELSAYLLQHPNTISFMSADEARKHPSLVIIQDLWQ